MLWGMKMRRRIKHPILELQIRARLTKAASEMELAPVQRLRGRGSLMAPQQE
jgi:hypothetical protein